MATNILEKVSINNSDQWLLVRGTNADNPLILQIQAGPGLPMISEANMFRKLHHLENDFLVAYWDQRGCGKSFNRNENPGNVNLNQLTEDVITCTVHLLKKYKKDKAILIGYSIGATLALMAAQRVPDLFSQVFLVGVDIDIPTANQSMMAFLMDNAKKTVNKRLLKKIVRLKTMEIDSAKPFQKRAKLLTNAGGIVSNKDYNEIFFSTLKNMLLTREYTMNEMLRVMRGMEFCQNALLPELNILNLFKKMDTIETPVHFIQGANDAVAPIEIARKFFGYLNANIKTFTEFHHSAHMPHLEEPAKFADVIRTGILKTYKTIDIRSLERSKTS